MNQPSRMGIHLLLVFIIHIAKAQDGGVSIGIDTPHPSAILHIQPTANNKGLLIPQLANSDIITLGGIAAEGLLVYDLTYKQFLARINGEWRSLNALVSNGLSTSDAYINTTGLIGLGTAPVVGGAKLQVSGSISSAGGYTAGGNVNVSGTVTANSFSGNGIVPAGGIIMWSGALANIPAGWTLCDGSNGTPDLRERFIVGASSTDNGTVAGNPYAVNANGGLIEVNLTESQMPPHTHKFRSGGNRGPGGSGREPGSWTDSNSAYPNEHTVERVGGVLVPAVMGVDNSGFPCTGWEEVDNGFGLELVQIPIGCNPNYGQPIIVQAAQLIAAPHENRPPYYALAFIMKL